MKIAPSTHSKATIATIGAAIVAFAFGLTETLFHNVANDTWQMAAAHAARASILATFALIWVSTVLACALEHHVRLMRWLPHVAAGLSLVMSVALNPSQWWIALILAAIMALVGSRLPWLRRPDVATLRVSILGLFLGLALAAVGRFHWGTPDSDAFLRNLLSDIFLIFALLGYFGSMGLRMVETRRGNFALIGIAFGAALVVSVALAWFHFGLYAAPKLLVVVGVALAFSTMVAGAEIVPKSSRPWRIASAIIWIIWFGAVALTLSKPVSERFGPYPLESMVGFTNAAYSLADDRDLDGYYDVKAGGNDCAPHQASTVFEIAKCIAPQAQPKEPVFHQPTFQRPVRHAFVLIVDALRPDEIGAGLREAPGRPKTPAFEALMARGVTFRHAYSSGNSTYESFRPMLAGVNPLVFYEVDPQIGESSHHRAHAKRSGLFSFQLPEFHTVLYQTPLFPDKLGYFGQDPQVEEVTGFTTESVIDAAEGWLNAWQAKGAVGSIAMVMYTYDPHAIYECLDGTEGGRRCYRDEVIGVDEGLSRLLSLFDRHGLWEESILVVLADHGEAFGEHGHEFHASSVYDEQVRVPIIVVHPDLAAGSKVDIPVSIMDLVPTLADALHTSAKTPSLFDSLLPLAAQKTQEGAPPIAYGFRDYNRPYPGRHSAIVEGSEKLIYDWGSRRSRLFDLAVDPDEQNDLATLRPDRVLEMEVLLAETIIATQVAPLGEP